jgi:hypothetical protein
VDRRLSGVVMVVAEAGCDCDGGAEKCCADGKMRETGEMKKRNSRMATSLNCEGSRRIPWESSQRL